MNRLTELSLRNRVLVGLGSLLVLVFGVLATGLLKQELLPPFEVPVASVVTPAPGMSPSAVADQVTGPIEAAVKAVDGVTTTRSTSSNGVSVVMAELEYGRDLAEVQREIETAVHGVSSLPDDVEPNVIAGSADVIPVLQLAVSSPLPEEEAARVLREQVVPLLTGVDGVRDVTLSGLRQQAVTIELDPAALAARGVSVSAIPEALRAAGATIPAGTVTAGAGPVPVQVGDPVTTIEQLADITLPGPRGSVRLGDVATITRAPDTATGYTRADGTPSVGVGITKLPDASSVAVSDEVHDLLDEIERLLGGGTATVVFDQATFIADSIEGLSTEGLLGLAFAVLVILLFLMSPRATVITGVSIPLSVLIALIALYVGDYSLNILTLGALTVAIGRVVDDSIVVIENIQRHLSAGETRGEAIRASVREVATAITSSTVTTVAVFLPIAFVGGQVGELFRPFALTVTVALLASLLVALTIIPVLASWFLRAPSERDDRRPKHQAEGERLQRAYLPVLRSALARPGITLLIAVGVLGGTGALVPVLETNFLDSSGQNAVIIEQELPPGTGLEDTDAAARRVEDVLASVPEVETYMVTVGVVDGVTQLGNAGPNTAMFFVTTDPDADQAALQDDLRRRLGALPDVGRVKVGEGAGMPGAGEIEVMVRAEDSQVLAEATALVEDAVRATEGASDVSSDLAADEPAVAVRVDRAAAAAAGLTETQVTQAVAAALRGTPAGELTLDGHPTQVVLRTGEPPADLDALRDLPVAGGTRLADVATVEEITAPATITRIDGQRAAVVTARPAAEDLGAVSADLRERLEELNLPAGASAELGGISAQQEEAFADLGLALLLSIAIVYLVMVATFRSLLQPLLLLVSVPFAATGALGLLLATDTTLGVPALIGLLMLVGIVVTNAIVLIDLVNQKRAAGAGIFDAVVEGARHRLRPILMTAVATVLALIPMSLGITKQGVFISRPLAIVVIGGLVSSTLLTLVLVPVLYLVVERFRARLRGRTDHRSEEERSNVAATTAAASTPHASGPAITGTVRNGDGTALPAAVLTLTSLDGRQIGRTVSGEDGGFHLPVPHGGDFVLIASAGTRPPTAHRVQVNGAPTVHDVVLAGSVVLSGLVRLPSGPLSGATVTVADQNGEIVAVTTSRADGTFGIEELPPGRYMVTATSPGRDPAVAAATVRDGEPTRVDLDLGGTAELVGTALALDGSAPVPGATAELRDASGAVVGRTVADVEGRFRFAHLAAGAYELTVTGPGPATAQLQVGDGEQVDTTVRLQADGVEENTADRAASAR